MAVRKSERAQGKLEVLDAARNLLVYTIKACGSEKIFPKKQRFLMANRIADEAISISVEIAKANATNLNEHYDFRRKCQEEARAHLQTIIMLIDVSYESFDIPPDKIEFWTGLCNRVSALLSSWMKSDKERMK